MEINVFKLCSGLKFLGYLMILLVAAIIAVSYDAIVIVTCGPQLLRGGAHSLIMLLWSYYRVVFKDPGSVPENWRAVLPEEALEAGSSLNDRPDCVVDTVGLDRRAFCNYCQNGKPPRCHHCSVCQRCVLKMDHHCVWVVNCVGARNYKFFLLFLLYTFMVTTMDTLVLLPAFINFFGEAKDHSSSPSDLAVIFLAFVLNLAFALSLLCFLVMHASLLSSNTTSIEVYEKRGAARWKYDLGRKKNFEQVFGTKKALWFFPLFSKEDVDNIPALHGLDFPIRADPES
ncbi:hypothetical protein OIU84_016253 [Salix udensis]|uniref:S-acyltransferase n=1 Tax=Salix udensis TaxID=889485 RepID=A0AAD6J921_9ROSI|nr:hypothetical protein OIU84_016253 [Salix udensis]